MTEIEKKAEEFLIKEYHLIRPKRLSDNEWENYVKSYSIEFKAYKDGYEQGQKEKMSYKDNYIKDLDGIIDTFKKENEELKAMFEIVCKERYGYAWEQRKSDLIENLKRRIEK